MECRPVAPKKECPPAGMSTLSVIGLVVLILLILIFIGFIVYLLIRRTYVPNQWTIDNYPDMYQNIGSANKISWTTLNDASGYVNEMRCLNPVPGGETTWDPISKTCGCTPTKWGETCDRDVHLSDFYIAGVSNELMDSEQSNKKPVTKDDCEASCGRSAACVGYTYVDRVTRTYTSDVRGICTLRTDVPIVEDILPNVTTVVASKGVTSKDTRSLDVTSKTFSLEKSIPKGKELYLKTTISPQSSLVTVYTGILPLRYYLNPKDVLFESNRTSLMTLAPDKVHDITKVIRRGYPAIINQTGKPFYIADNPFMFNALLINEETLLTQQVRQFLSNSGYTFYGRYSVI
jgi:hypothetical protein